MRILDEKTGEIIDFDKYTEIFLDAFDNGKIITNRFKMLK